MGNSRSRWESVAKTLTLRASPVRTMNPMQVKSPPVRWDTPATTWGPAVAPTPRLPTIPHPLIPASGGPPPVMWGRMVMLALVGTLVMLLVLSALGLIQFDTWLPLRWCERMLARVLSSSDQDGPPPPPAPRPWFPMQLPYQRSLGAAVPPVPSIGHATTSATASATVPAPASMWALVESAVEPPVMAVTGQAEAEHRLTSKLEEAVQKALGEIFRVRFSKVRPTFLRNPASGRALELDLFAEVPVPGAQPRRVACEVDETHHFCFPNSRHKSMEEFELQKYRDAIKTSLCRANDVTLIRVPFTVARKDVDAFLRNELRKAGVHIPQVPLSAVTPAGAAASLLRRNASVPRSSADAAATGPESGR